MSAHLAFPTSFSAAKIFQDKFDVTLLHAKPEVAAQERMVDDGNGKVEVRPVCAAFGLWDVPAAEKGSPFCMPLSPLHLSIRSKKCGVGCLPTMLQESERHFPQWSITWKICSSHLCRWDSSQDSSLANVTGLGGTKDPGGEGHLRWMLELHPHLESVQHCPVPFRWDSLSRMLLSEGLCLLLCPGLEN